ncbi:MAG: HNH endonuclease [Nanoarchaeota archaeon]|nr:HNH endonuclease [Nanoarchaeota archaeon]
MVITNKYGKIPKDKHLCSKCGIQYHLTVHHKDGIANGKRNNLQVLCRKCHDDVHGINHWRPKLGDGSKYSTTTIKRYVHPHKLVHNITCWECMKKIPDEFIEVVNGKFESWHPYCEEHINRNIKWKQN